MGSWHFGRLPPVGRSLGPSKLGKWEGRAVGSILVYALLSIGTSISFLPSQRDIITRGAYRFVRHPILYGCVHRSIGVHTARLFSFEFSDCHNLIVLLMVRSVVEERFLREDTVYAAYLKQVR